MPLATVLVRTLNEARNLGRTLEAVFEQSLRDFELVVVDSGSTDETLDIVSRYPCRIFHIEKGAFTYGRALNLGCREARGSLVVLLSAHALPASKGWLAAMLDPFSDSAIAGVMGRELPQPDCNPFDRRGLLRRYQSGPAKDLNLDGGIGFGAANGAIRRQVWRMFPFDEELPYAEDLDWARRVLDAGYRLRYEPQAAAFHSHNESLSKISHRSYNEAAAERRLGLKTRKNKIGLLLLDSTLVPLYDVGYLLAKREKLRWLALALPRRWAMNFGRYKGYRGMAPDLGVLDATFSRALVALIRRANFFLSDRAATVACWTCKSRYRIHPKHLLRELPERDWYLPLLQPFMRVLDAGCSHGGHTIRAADRVALVAGFDRDMAQLKVGSQRASDAKCRKVCFQIADAEKPWPYANERFDCVLALDILEHVHARQLFLAECLRVLRLDGKLLVAVPNRETSWKRLLRRVGLPYFSDPDHKVEYTRTELEKELSRAGFKMESCSPVVYDTPWFGLIDMAGGITLDVYRRLCAWKRRTALKNPEESTGFRVVAVRS